MPESSAADLTEEVLVRNAVRGDREAFAALYEQNVERVYRYVLSRLGDAADAEDVTAEVFIRAMKAISSYTPRGVPFIAWLLRIAHNQTVNHVQQRTRRRESPLPEGDITPSTEDVEEIALRQAVSGELSRAMLELTDLQQQVLQLRFANELSVAETATAMNRSPEAVRFLQYSALKALRRTLERAGAEDVRGR
jgi:RNA polymerase sigma-70 factor (ECF subfamily)